ncbi:hypothetical protein J6590_055664 [Homalodisca vitripennis]|nr:hypothetical protein J6590_055664 [Homalodisca vitripennis]
MNITCNTPLYDMAALACNVRCLAPSTLCPAYSTSTPFRATVRSLTCLHDAEEGRGRTPAGMVHLGKVPVKYVNSDDSYVIALYTNEQFL